MIDKALSFITTYVNQELKASFGLSEDKVIAGSLINPDGSVTENMENKIIVTIINIENETFAGNTQSAYKQSGENNYAKQEPPLYINLYLLFAANYTSKNYLESLKMLSAAIAMIQANPTFERNNFPEMDPQIDRLTMEIHNIPINELSHIWSGIGAKYVPSMIYKLRMLAVQKAKIQSTVSGISGLDSSTTKKN
ncbi:MAG: DUF4255 domain-containing protein [Bacteroidetes bacterium]|nr:MAG: DUF4255 domain-containing protein [Bacteroidota bacterium]